jgi:hypothetical protein
MPQPQAPDAAARSADADALDEADAKAVLLVRAFESPLTPPWTEADAAWATREAERLEGEHAPTPRFLARRAWLACERLARHGVHSRAAPVLPIGWVAATAVLAAFGLGLFSDAVAGARRINILAPPLLALLAWNLGVYLVLAVAWIARLRRPAADAAAGRPLREAVLRMAQRAAQWMSGAVRRADAPALARFTLDWAHAARPLHGARIAAVLHAAAAALALGALGSLYARGLAFEYRAGWDSTFLDAADVQRIVSAVLGPAAHWTGTALPDAPQLAALRFAAGPGENAAAWIHLYAVTVAAVVLLPRLLLAAASAWHARHLAGRFALPLDDPYFRGVLRGRGGSGLEVRVLPYSYHLPAQLLPGLQAALRRAFGPAVRMELAEAVPLAGEETWRPPASASTLVALFPLTATPERESHGAFVRALHAAPARAAVMVLVDESGFRRRFTGPDGATRLAQRRAAWQRMLQDLGEAPVFIDLAHAQESDAGASP